MKNLIFTVAFALIACSTALAQTSAGTVATTVDAYYFRGTSNGSQPTLDITNKFKSVVFIISPKVGYFVSDNMEIGALVKFHGGNYSQHSVAQAEQYNSSHTDKNYGQGYMLYVRRYMFITDKIAFHGTASAGVSTVKGTSIAVNQNSIPYSEADYKDTNFEAALSPGISYFLSEQVGISASLGALHYNNNSLKNENNIWEPYENKANKLSFDFSSENVSLGLSYYFSR